MKEIKGTLFLSKEGKAKLALGQPLGPCDFRLWPKDWGNDGEFPVREILIQPEELLDRETACQEAAAEIDEAIKAADAAHAKNIADMLALKQKFLALPAPTSGKPAEDVDFDDIPF